MTDIEQNELLCVEDSYVLKDRGVVLIPDFSLPDTGWKGRELIVHVKTPDGSVSEMTARIDIAWFTLTDPNATADQKLRVVVRLVDATDKLPVGTRVYAPQEVCDTLIGNSA